MKYKIIPIIFLANEEKAFLVGTAIQSIFENRNLNYFYKVYVLYNTLSERTIAILRNVTANNFHVICLSILQYIEQNNFFNSPLSRECILLEVPKIFSQYHKVIYFNTNVICCKDCSKLLNIDIGNNLIAGVQKSLDQQTIDEKLALGLDPLNYISTDVIIFNNYQFNIENKNQNIKTICHTLEMNKGLIFEDMINLCFQNRIFLLPSLWLPHKSSEFFQKEKSSPKDSCSLCSAEPYIICTNDPFRTWDSCDYINSFFWQYARKTTFYEQILFEIKRKNFDSVLPDKFSLNFDSTYKGEKVSIIVPVYNTEKYLDTCMNSLINQTHSNLEIICINDGSTDSSIKILQKYAQKDSRIKIINQEHQGIYCARNTGLLKVTSNYVVFVNSNDYVHPNYISKLYYAITSNNSDFAICDILYVDQSIKTSKFLELNYNKNISNCIKNDINPMDIPQTSCGKIYKMSLIKRNKLVFLKNLCFGDSYWHFLFCHFSNSYSIVYEKLYFYRAEQRKVPEYTSIKHKYDLIKICCEIFLTLSHKKDFDCKNLNRFFFQNFENLRDKNGIISKDLFFWARKYLKLSDWAREQFYIKYRTQLPLKKGILSNINPIISVIVASYNYEDYIQKTLNSLLEQTFKDFEIIVVDDGSQDDSLNIIKEYQKKYKNLFLYTHKNGKNLGLPATLKLALSKARGQWIFFCESDDFWTPNHLEEFITYKKKNPKAQFVANDVICFGAFGSQSMATYCNQYLSKIPFEKNLVQMSYYHNIIPTFSCWGVEKALLQNCIFENCPISAAIDYWLILQLLHKYRVYHIPMKLTYWRQHSNSQFAKDRDKYLGMLPVFRKKIDVLLDRTFMTLYNKEKKQKEILFMDATIPRYDSSCGERASFQYLQFFLKQNYIITFFSKNKGPNDYHLQTLLHMGINVVCCNDKNNTEWKIWIQHNGNRFKYIFLNRPDVAWDYLEDLKQYTHGKIIYFGHDLHYRRFMRAYGISHDENLKCSYQKFYQIERNILSKVDIALYFSDIEVFIAKSMGAKKAYTVPLHIYTKNELEHINYIASDRKDIIFVGFFNHHPNADAILWFVKEIWPSIQKRNFNINLHIVGDLIPLEIKQLASPFIKIHGFMSDIDLDKLYSQIKISIVPLRYGAGVKGKVLEALRRGIPVITTPIGAEGIPNDNEAITIANNTEDFIRMLLELYTDNKKLDKLSKLSLSLIKNNFSEDILQKKFFNKYNIIED